MPPVCAASWSCQLHRLLLYGYASPLALGFAFLASVLSALSTEIARCRARGDIRYGFSMGFTVVNEWVWRRVGARPVVYTVRYCVRCAM